MTNYMLPEYEKHCLSEYLSTREDSLIFANKGDEQLNNLTSMIVMIIKQNDFSFFLKI